MKDNFGKKIFFFGKEFLGLFAGIWAFIAFFKSFISKIQSQVVWKEDGWVIFLKQIFSSVKWFGILLFVIFFIYIVKRIKNRWSFNDLGFKIHRSWRKDIWFGVVIFALQYLIALPITILTFRFRANLMKGGFLNDISQSSSPAYVIILAIFFMAFATCVCAFWEEVYWRGYLQNLFSREMAPAVGFFASVIFFSLSHYITRPYSLAFVVLVLIGGITLCLAFYATRSVWVVLVIHTLGNLWGDYPVYLYLNGSIQSSYIFIAALGIVLFVVCIIGREEMKYFMAKTKELFVVSGWKMSFVGIFIGIVSLLYCWAQNLLKINVGKELFLGVLVIFSILALGVSFAYKEKEKIQKE